MHAERRPLEMAVRRGTSIWWLTAGLLIVCHAVAMTGCKREPETVRAVNASFVQAYSLSLSADSEHPISIVGPNGKTWYRGATPVFDLGHCRIEGTFTVSVVKGEYRVVLAMKDSAQPALGRWTGEHIGEHLGMVVDGRLSSVAQVVTKISARISIDGFSTEEEALKVARRIEQGG